MKKLMCFLMTLVLLALCAGSALAYGNGTILDYWTDFKNLVVYASVGQEYRTTLSFMVSVDNSEEVPVTAEALPSSMIGHIIVVDTSMPYSNPSHVWLTYENAYLPILQTYLSVIGNGEKVKFIIADAGSSVTETDWMMNNQAQDFIRNNIKLSTKVGGTGINQAITMALKDMDTVQENQPLFKNVFALVDADSTNDTGNLTKGSGTFPFFLVTIAQTGTDATNQRTQKLNSSFNAYQNFANANNGVYICAERVKTNDIDVSNVATRVSSVLNSLQYYKIDMSNAHSKIDYSKTQHRFALTAYSSEGTTQVNVLMANTEVLPTAIPTATPSPSPEPTIIEAPTPAVITPEPSPTPVVVREGNDGNALKVIRRLWELYYLEERPNAFDDSCRFAFMEFCVDNGLEEMDYVDNAAFDLLMYGNPKPKATVTPVPTPTEAPQVVETPVPKAYIGSKSTSAFYIIKQLQKLYYLDPDQTYKEFDTECKSAFLDFCSDNGINYQEEYIDDDAYQFLMSATTPKATPTPVPVATPVPAPTIPPQGYELGSRDPVGATFISSMQTILAGLNLYTDEYMPGTIEQSTLDAVARYCELYGLRNVNGKDSISQQIVNDVLTMGENRVPYEEPEPSASEKLLQTLKRGVFSLGGLVVQMWMLLVLILVLVFTILLIIILMNSKRKKDGNDHTRTHTDSGKPNSGSSGSSGEAKPTPSRPMPDMDSNETQPVGLGRRGGDDDDILPTLPQSAALRVTFTISGNCQTWTDSRLITTKDFVIGRASSCDLQTDPSDRTISSKHAILTSRKGALYIRDISTFKATWVNGTSIAKEDAPMVDGPTVPIRKRSTSGGNDDYVLNSGDEITLGERCRIKVVW